MKFPFLQRNRQQEVNKVQVRRFHVKMDAEFMTAFMNSLNQELYILRDSEEIETQLLLNAKTAMSTRNDLQMVINSTNRQLDELRRNIDKLGEQADNKSLDSLDMTTIRLDEATCPTGLDRSLYDLAFSMRSDRHDLERNVRELTREVENKRKEIAEMQIKMKFHEEVYQREKNALLQFRVSSSIRDWSP